MTLIHVQTFPTLLTLKLNLGFRFVGLGINLKYQCDHCDTIKTSSYCDISNKVWHYWQNVRIFANFDSSTKLWHCSNVSTSENAIINKLCSGAKWRSLGTAASWWSAWQRAGTAESTPASQQSAPSPPFSFTFSIGTLRSKLSLEKVKKRNQCES